MTLLNGNIIHRQVVAGRGAPQPLRKDIPKLRDATPWDGKDGEV